MCVLHWEEIITKIPPHVYIFCVLRSKGVPVHIGSLTFSEVSLKPTGVSISHYPPCPCLVFLLISVLFYLSSPPDLMTHGESEIKDPFLVS